MSAELEHRISQNRNLVGLSNMGQNGQPLRYAYDAIQPLLGGRTDVIVDTTAKATNEARDAQAEQLRVAFGELNITTHALHRMDQASRQSAIRDAQGFYIGGGNTGLLTSSIHAARHENGKLVDPTSTANEVSVADMYREAVANGVPVIGHSAGTMMMAEDIRTYGLGDNIAFLRRSKKGLHADVTGLDLLSQGFTYFPHFNDNNALFNEMLEADPTLRVLAGRNGAYFAVNGMRMTIGGETSATLFQNAQEPKTFTPGTDVSYLLKH
ncbi:MAG: Type 1 glutamine amidotransferase-like domain-containing protein [Candidatus Levybacteria bacterium]|nr:Type 1 glutamine amidotransferase-like domain-containing protein [Candidatus Levybacteria bacterium]